jgi:hypothetical protein
MGSVSAYKQFQAAVYKNGSPICFAFAWSIGVAGAPVSCQVVDVINLAADDILEAYFYNGDVADRVLGNTFGDNVFAAALVGN